MKREVPYLDLARKAVESGNFTLFWHYFKQNARVKRKQWAKEKATSANAAHR